MKSKPYIIIPVALTAILGALILLSLVDVEINMRNFIILISSATIVGAIRITIASIAQSVIQFESRRRMRKLMGFPKPNRSDDDRGQPFNEESASNK